jgi:PAS domain S-box-containing protein
MKDGYKTRQQLLEELSKLERRVLSLERANKKLKKDKIELEKDAKRLRLIFDNAPVGVYISTPEGRYLKVNHTQADILGYESPEEIVRSVTDIKNQIYVEPEDRDRLERLLAEQGTVKGFETRFYRKDGKVIWVSIHIQALRDEEDKVFYQGTVIDITERRQAEEALRESERRYRHLTNFVPMPLFEVDLAGNFRTGNVAVSEAFGYTEKDVENGLNITQVIIPEDIERIVSDMKEILRRGKVKGPGPGYECTGIKKDGSTFPFLAHAGPMFHQGKPVGFRGAIIDLTRQRQAEETLRRSAFSLAEAQKVAHIGHWEWDFSNGDMYWSDELCRIMGTQPCAFARTFAALCELLSPEDREAVKGAVEKTVKEGRESEIEHRIIRPEGTVRDVLQRVEPIADRDGKIIRAIGLVQDVTEKKQREMELQKTKEQLIQAEKLSSLGRLSAGVAHEILNPASILSMELQLLQKMEGLAPEVQEELNVCMEQVGRIVVIAENLKQFSRVPVKNTAMADMNGLIKHMMTLYATQLKMEGIETDVQYDPDLPAVAVDKEKIGQVIMNLITNAVSAMEGKEKKVLHIKTGRNAVHRKGDHLTITVADTGKGIPAEHMPKIFDPFFTTKGPGKGTGLGLSISYGIVREHGGMIRAENNEWGGASFYVSLPLQKEGLRSDH